MRKHVFWSLPLGVAAVGIILIVLLAGFPLWVQLMVESVVLTVIVTVTATVISPLLARQRRRAMPPLTKECQDTLFVLEAYGPALPKMAEMRSFFPYILDWFFGEMYDGKTDVVQLVHDNISTKMQLQDAQSHNRELAAQLAARNQEIASMAHDNEKLTQKVAELVTDRFQQKLQQQPVVTAAEKAPVKKQEQTNAGVAHDAVGREYVHPGKCFLCGKKKAVTTLAKGVILRKGDQPRTFRWCEECRELLGAGVTLQSAGAQPGGGDAHKSQGNANSTVSAVHG